jgi:cell division transport system permease protein
MKNWLREHGLAMRDALVRLGRHFVATVLNLLVIGIALSLPLALYILLENVSAFSQQAAAEPQLTLFLRNDADQTDAQSMEARLRAHPAVARVQFVTKDRALANLEKSAGLSGVVEELGSNPLPDAFVITGHAEQAEALESLRIEAAKWAKVDHAQLDTVWARQVEAALRAGRATVAALGLLLGIALVAITFNTIRLQILNRREEIEVSKLIGATNGFIRRPFLYLGALQGLMGGGIAWGLVLLAVNALERELGVAVSLVSPSGHLASLGLPETAVLGVAATMLGWLGAWLSVSLHLRRFEPA